MDIYLRSRPDGSRLVFVSLVLLYLALPSSTGLSCAAFNVTDGVQAAPLQAHYEYPDNVTFSCENTSLALVGRSVRHCLHTGSWDTQLPVCQAIRCPIIAVPKNGTLFYEHKNGSIIAQFSCDMSHILIGQQLITCHQNGSWTDAPPRCLVDCSSPPGLENAIFSFNCSLPNCPAVYSCDEGYALNGSDSRLCTSTGSWTDTQQSCEPTTCTWPMLPPGGNFSTSIPPSGEKFVYNTTLRYWCEPRSVLVGNGTMWCGPSGKWQGSQLNCVKPNIPSTSTERSNITTSTPVTSTRVQNVTSTTTRNPTTTSIPERPCPRPPAVANGSPDTGHNPDRKYLPGDYVKYNCDSGFYVQGADKLECLDDGSWSTPAPICLEEAVTTPRPFLWKQVFIDNKKWIGEYEFKNRRYYFQFHVNSVDIDNQGSILGLFSEDHGSRFDVKGFQRENDIVFEIEAMHQANSRIKDTDWYVHGNLRQGLCTWKYEGQISSPTEGFTTLSMESDIEEKMDDPLCSNRHHMTLIIVSVSVAVLMVVAVAIVAYYCSKRKGGFRSSGHRSLTSFENPVYEYEHSLK